MKMICEQLSSYDDLDGEFAGVVVSQRDRKKDTVPARTRSKKRTSRKRGGPTSIVGISHRRLRNWSNWS